MINDYFSNLLSAPESQIEVISPVFGVQFGPFECLWKVIMNKGAECHAVIPTGGKVCDFQILKNKITI